MACSICTENFTSRNRKKIICINNDCQSDYCLECFKNYLLKSEEYNQKCMVCSTSYTLKDIFSQCNSQSFINDVMDKITNISLNNQKNLLPDSQPEAKRIIENRKFILWEKKIRDEELVPLELKMKEIRHKIYLKRCEIEEMGRKKEPENNYTFIKQCSYPNCNGLLSKSWKCPLCDKNTCSQCHEPKEENHECDEDMIKNIEAVKKDSKPCPKCGTAISKIDGCDQMYCVSCHTAFSWRTGKIETGNIHNPEYFRYRRENNLDIPRNPNAGRGFEINECFDPLDDRNHNRVFAWLVNQMRNYLNINNLNYGRNKTNLECSIVAFFRYTYHIKAVVLEKFSSFNNINDCFSKLRVNYLVKDITESGWAIEIKKKTKENSKNRSLYEIINTYLKIWGDIVMNIIYILENSDSNTVREIKKQFEIFQNYTNTTNEEMNKIRKIFKSSSKSLFHVELVPKQTISGDLDSYISIYYGVK